MENTKIIEYFDFDKYYKCVGYCWYELVTDLPENLVELSVVGMANPYLGLVDSGNILIDRVVYPYSGWIKYECGEPVGFVYEKPYKNVVWC